ncbi:hypothetical protein L2E82_30190 [Cichorium intybus]|uniref:Uncharacterized protein n=1 Tax=Cichorium intybus TaxID=13427 RepID=A0ACB9CZM9_CICIN|nr:hypothetical protein L2E82_30190 [Cichorium intybus]
MILQAGFQRSSRLKGLSDGLPKIIKAEGVAGLVSIGFNVGSGKGGFGRFEDLYNRELKIIDNEEDEGNWVRFQGLKQIERPTISSSSLIVDF